MDPLIFPEPEVVTVRALTDTGQQIRVNVTVPLRESPLLRPRVDFMVDRNLWILAEEYRYQDGDHALIVPFGFTLNLASIPRPLWTLVSTFELGLVGPIIHDFLYGCGGNPPAGTCVPHRTYTRDEADVLFKELMKREKVPDWRWRTAYQAVRSFGASAWRGA